MASAQTLPATANDRTNAKSALAEVNAKSQRIVKRGINMPSILACTRQFASAEGTGLHANSPAELR
jgi:hypothetical protein